MSEVRAIEELFGELIELEDAYKRREYLDKACGDDQSLRSQLEKLLADHQRAGSFLGDDLDVTLDRPHTEKIGSLIGPYKLLEKIGEGGMGVVYMAEQREPVKRRVALKIIKPGMDTSQVIARFEAERQALALMDHPHIAKVFDAGATESGRPYFVMELINGIPITEYCDDHHLTLQERLALFVPICQAVQHAHQKGLIHRDLKPSNILVAEYDHEAVPKIIDFGVAKATSQQLTDKTLFTQFGQIIGTLEYAAPEQAKRNQLDIDTRSDIYSLGVVLYELLTGDTPFGRERLKSAALDEMLQMLREEDPPPPSTRLSASATLPAVAANRQIEPGKLSKAVRREPDWIVMKSLAKDRDRRYETASALAEDIQRYLAGEPVQAGPPTLRYRIGKLYRRHRAATFCVFTVSAAVLIALCVTSIAWLDARHQRRLAEASQEATAQAESEARASAESNRAMLDLLVESIVLKDKSGSRSVEDVLDSLVRGIPEASELDDATLADLNYVVGIRMLESRRLDEASDHLNKALEHAGLKTEVRAICLRYVGFLEQDQRLIEQAIALEETAGLVQGRAQSMSLLGFLKLEGGQMEDATDILQRAKSLFADVRRPSVILLPEIPIVGEAVDVGLTGNDVELQDSAREQAARWMGYSTHRWMDVAYSWSSRGRPFVAKAAIRIVRRDADGIHSSAWASWRSGDYEQAFFSMQACHQAYASESQHEKAFWRLSIPALWHAQAGNYKRAIAQLERPLEYARQNSNVPQKAVLWNQYELAELLEHVGRQEEAKELFATVATALLKKIRDGEPVWDRGTSETGYSDIAAFVHCAVRVDAIQLPDDLVEEFTEKVLLHPNPDIGRALAAAIYLSYINVDSALAHYQQVVRENRGWHHSVDYLTRRLSRQLVEANRVDRAISLLEFRVESRNAQRTDASISRYLPQIELAKLLIKVGRDLPRARRLLLESRQAIARPPFEHAESVNEINSLLSQLGE